MLPRMCVQVEVMDEMGLVHQDIKVKSGRCGGVGEQTGRGDG